MKKAIFFLAIFFFGCKEVKFTDEKVKCCITEVTPHYIYGGTIPGLKYTLRTSCNYTFVTSHHFNVGDTIEVTVRTVDKTRTNAPLMNK